MGKTVYSYILSAGAGKAGIRQGNAKKVVKNCE